MPRLIATLLLFLSASPALANDPYCERPWFIRNLIFDRAGYCFSSALGQSVFDNSDCTGTDIALSDRDSQAVAQIRELEDWLGCDMDTSVRRLQTVSELEDLRRFAVLPVPVDGAYGCIGYLGPDLPLYTAPGATHGPVMGTIRRGSSILFEYMPEAGWDFVTAYATGWKGPPSASGWLDMRNGEPDCEDYAG